MLLTRFRRAMAATGSRRKGAIRGQGGGVALSLEAQILAAVSDGTVFGLTVPRAANVDATEIGSYTDLSGLSNTYTQGTASAKPDLIASAFGNADGINFDGGDFLQSSNVDLTPYAAIGIFGVLKDTITAQKFWAMVGTLATDYLLARLNPSTDEIEAQAAVSGVTRANSAASFPMTTAGVIGCTWDGSLSTDECVIRHDGSDVTNARAVNSNNTPPMADGPLTLGSLDTGASGFTGVLGPVVKIGWPTSMFASERDAVETLLINALAAGSWD